METKLNPVEKSDVTETPRTTVDGIGIAKYPDLGKAIRDSAIVETTWYVTPAFMEAFDKAIKDEVARIWGDVDPVDTSRPDTSIGIKTQIENSAHIACRSKDLTIDKLKATVKNIFNEKHIKASGGNVFPF